MPRQSQVNYGEVVDVVMAVKGVDLDMLMGSSKMPRVVEARRMVACTMRHLGHSYPDIAKMMRREHHSSAHTMVKHVKNAGYYDKVIYQVLRLVYERRLGMTNAKWIEKEFDR